MDTSSSLENKHILIIIENLPAPLDRRVWQEALALKEFGARVSIICPKMKGYNRSYEVIDGVEIYRHPLPVEADSAKGYLLEYGFSLFFEFFLAMRIFLKTRFHVIQACNPPDLIFLVALPFKVMGVKFIFDHHDLNPELFESKFGKKNLLYRLVVLFEKLTFKTANYSIATNESFKEIAVRRGGKQPQKVAVVRSGPDTSKFVIKTPNEKYKRQRKFLVAYVGVIAEQDGLDLLMKIIQIITLKRTDVQFAILGDGTSLNDIKQLSKELNISDYVDFYGMVTDRNLLLEILSTCDVGVNPDLPDRFNDLITSNKVMEYMALKKPVVQFNLKEGKNTAGEASLYAQDGSLDDFADKISTLLDNTELRKTLGEIGYNKIKNELSWEHQKKNYIDLYQSALKN